jgi:heme exporter protein B
LKPVAIRATLLVFRRDLRLAFRRASEWIIPLLFFLSISVMFPLALSPDRLAMSPGETEQYGMQSLGIGVLWMAALVSSLMGLDRLFLNDVEDGSMEQLLLGPAPLLSIVFGKLAAHWLVSGLPLILLVPVLGLLYRLPVDAALVLMLAVSLATPTLTILVAIGAALTLNLRGAAAIVGLLILPLCSPILIFGARATLLALDAVSPAGPLYLLASLSVLALSLGPIAIAAALKVSLE